ncbi:MAG: 2OG-Fe(II) oxygenase [Acidovorax sp.]|uniref:2OG-Fe(II) oxygenase n=1 Tax=Acidovorax sp. TaxID=1872122 RepID=UPI0039E2DF85
MSADYIEIVDNFLSPEEWKQSGISLTGDIWQYGWPRRSHLNEHPTWHVFIAGRNRPEEKSCLEELSSNDRWRFLIPVWQRIKEKYMPDADLRGVYANGHTYGIESSIHRDSRKGEYTKTALLFMHRIWPTTWGGETCFYSTTSEDLIKSVIPKPNRLVVFDGEIPHNVRSPSIGCELLRISIAFKTHIRFK